MVIDAVSMASAGLAFFIVAVSPGPATLSNATIAMSHGRRASFLYGAGLSCGLVFWGIVAATGMGAILQGSLYLLTALKVLGGCYLLWLALQSGRSALQGNAKAAVVPGNKRWFIRGLLLNVSNPKSVIAWMAALSVGLGSNTDGAALIAATVICSVVGFVTNMLYTLLFSVDGMMMGYQRFRRKIDGAVALLFASAGLGLLRSAASS